MSSAKSKLWRASEHIYVFHCPGCGYGHHIDTRRWAFNGDLSRPTVTPSLLIHPGDQTPRCHLFVTDGQLRFLADCGHALAGKTVDMEPSDGEDEKGGKHE